MSTINYGKRKPGGLTAADPGDTIYIPFATYNDSGASVAMSGFAATDIEIFKNGDATPRATDSGYSVISDTGQYGDRPGLNRFSVQIFNTADDTGFYESGAQYHVAIDSITVDGRTVKFFPAVFELGYAEVDVKRIDGDTGAADRLGKFAGDQLAADGTMDTGTGLNNVTASVDTGEVCNAIWEAARTDHTTAGTFGEYVTANVDLIDGDTGAADRLQKFAGEQLATDGTMDTGTGLNNVTASVDTGEVSNAIWNSQRADHTTAGSFGASDTGINGRLGVLETGVNVTSIADTGLNNRLDVILSDTDTGIQGGVNVTGFSDTGVNQRLTALETGVNVTSIADTGINNRLDVILSDTDTGIQGGVNIIQIRGDTGAADRLLKFSGSQLAGDGTLDTGSGIVNITTDTGQSVNAIWNALRSDHTTAGSFGASDTGINERLAQILADTDTGIQASVNVTGFADTGVNDRLARILADTDTGIQGGVNVISIADTGINNRLDVIASDTDTGIKSGVTVTSLSDTGVNARLNTIQTKTDSLTFTVSGQVDSNIQYVNDVEVTGTGASGDEWGP
jgi:hypothetical protein